MEGCSAAVFVLALPPAHFSPREVTLAVATSAVAGMVAYALASHGSFFTNHHGEPISPTLDDTFHRVPVICAACTRHHMASCANLGQVHAVGGQRSAAIQRSPHHTSNGIAACHSRRHEQAGAQATAHMELPQHLRWVRLIRDSAMRQTTTAW